MSLMNNQEQYQHSRNYACRIREFQMEGRDMVSLENDRIKVVVLAGKGCDIIEFLYKPQDVDFLWHSFRQQLPPHGAQTESGGFPDSYYGGWQVLFPGIGVSEPYKGAAVGKHGEVALLPWRYSILTDTPEEISVRFWVRCVRTPFLLQRTMTLGLHSLELVVEETAVNEGTEEEGFFWGQHPALGPLFLDEHCEILLPGSPTVCTMPGDLGPRCPLSPDLSATWPVVPGREGEPVDLSKVPPRSGKSVREFGLKNLASPEYVVYNHALKLGWGMRWDAEVYPNLWVWQMYGGGLGYPFYGRAYCLALEPWSCLPAHILPGENGQRTVLAGGQSLTHRYTAFVQAD